VAGPRLARAAATGKVDRPELLSVRLDNASEVAGAKRLQHAGARVSSLG